MEERKGENKRGLEEYIKVEDLEGSKQRITENALVRWVGTTYILSLVKVKIA